LKLKYVSIFLDNGSASYKCNHLVLVKKGAPLPDAADGVEGREGVVVRVAIVQVHVPRVRATVLSSGPEVVGGGLLPAADFKMTPLFIPGERGSKA
jgi:hypothetical protein